MTELHPSETATSCPSGRPARSAAHQPRQAPPIRLWSSRTVRARDRGAQPVGLRAAALLAPPAGDSAASSCSLAIFGCGALRELHRAVHVRADRPRHRSASARPQEHTSSAPTSVGRDFFSRVLYGIRTSARVGVLVGVLSPLSARSIGGLAGYYGGWIDNMLMRVTDLVLTLPALAVLLDGGRAARSGHAVARRASSWRFLLDAARAHRARQLPVAAREGVRRGGEGGRRRRHPDHVPPHASEHARADRRQRDADGRRGDPARGGALVPRLRDQAADAGARRAHRRRSGPGLDKWWLVTFPGVVDRDHRALHQLRRRRASRRARSARSGESVPEPLLSIRDLVVEFSTEDGVVHAVDGVTYDVFPGETLGDRRRVRARARASATMSILGLIPQPPGRIVERRGDVQGPGPAEDSKKELRRFRGDEVAMVFQDPMTSLNPVLKVGYQLGEAIKTHYPEVKRRRGQEAGRRRCSSSSASRTPSSAVRPVSARVLGRHAPARDDRDGDRERAVRC